MAVGKAVDIWLAETGSIVGIDQVSLETWPPLQVAVAIAGSSRSRYSCIDGDMFLSLIPMGIVIELQVHS